MNIREKIFGELNQLIEHGPITIVAFGDSVTHGCFEIFMRDNKLETAVRTAQAYHEKLRTIFASLYPDVPLCIINAGISGDCAKTGLDRLNRDVISYNPDLVVVCYGLNDSMQGEQGLSDYVNSLKEVFLQIRQSGKDVIFMTPNMRTDRICEPFDDKNLAQAADSVVQNEAEGWLDTYLDAAKELCSQLEITVCDCNAVWKNITNKGVKVNNLLSNRINHPTEQLHWLFAYELVKTIFSM